MILNMRLENLFSSCCILVFTSTSISSLFSHSLILNSNVYYVPLYYMCVIHFIILKGVIVKRFP